jgi:hypothetical protein
MSINVVSRLNCKAYVFHARRNRLVFSGIEQRKSFAEMQHAEVESMTAQTAGEWRKHAGIPSDDDDDDPYGPGSVTNGVREISLEENCSHAKGDSLIGKDAASTGDPLREFSTLAIVYITK